MHAARNCKEYVDLLTELSSKAAVGSSAVLGGIIKFYFSLTFSLERYQATL